MNVSHKEITVASIAALALILGMPARANDDPKNKPAQPTDFTPTAVGATQSSSAAQSQSTTIQGAATTGAASQQSAGIAEEAVRVASNEDERITDRKLAGRSVRGSDGKSLGNLKDFLIETGTGKIAYGVVSTGGFAGVGEKLRLVPFDALKGTSDQDEYDLNIDKEQWDELPSMKDNELDQGSIAMAESDRRRVAAHFGGDASTGFAASGSSAAMTSHLMRASDLRGRDLHSGSREIGEIEGLVIDAATGTASALVDVKNDFVDSDHKFLVPLGRLALGDSKRDDVTTMLTSEDFQQPRKTAVANTGASYAATNAAGTSSQEASPTTSANAADDPAVQSPTEKPAAAGQATDSQVASSSSSRRNPDSTKEQGQDPASESTVAARALPGASSTSENADTTSSTSKSRADEQVASTTQSTTDEPALSPTGRTGADQSLTSDPALMTTARAIREALDGDETLRSAAVEVKPESGKIVLRGTVQDEALKSSLEKKAKAAAADHEIDVQVTVGTP